MDDEIKDENLEEKESWTEESESDSPEQPEGHSDYHPVSRFDAAAVHHLSGMYQN